MDIGSFLAPEHALIDVQASKKTRLLADLSAQAAASLALAPEFVAHEILKREELGSTGIGGGVAVPHARISGLAKPFGVLARLRKPIDFDAIDKQPVDLVFLLLLPATSTEDPLKALAAVARKFRDAEVMTALRRAQDGANLHRAITAET